MMRNVQTPYLIKRYFQYSFRGVIDFGSEVTLPVLGRAYSSEGWFWFLSTGGYLFFDIQTASAVYHPRIKRIFSVKLINGLNCQEFPYPVYMAKLSNRKEAPMVVCEVGQDYKGPHFLCDVEVIPYPEQNWNNF